MINSNPLKPVCRCTDDRVKRVQNVKEKNNNTKKEINYCLAVGWGEWRELQFFSLSTKPGLG